MRKDEEFTRKINVENIDKSKVIDVKNVNKSKINKNQSALRKRGFSTHSQSHRKFSGLSLPPFGYINYSQMYSTLVGTTHATGAADSKVSLASTNSTKDYSSKFITHLLKLLYSDNNTKYYNNFELQKSIESIIIDEYDLFFSNNAYKYTIGGIDRNILGGSLTKYVSSKEELLTFYIDKLKKSYSENKYSREEEIFIGNIINKLDSKFILNLCLVHYLLVYTYQKSDNDKNYNLLGVSIIIGNKMLNKYFNTLKYEQNATTLYSEFVEK